MKKLSLVFIALALCLMVSCNEGTENTPVTTSPEITTNATVAENTVAQATEEPTVTETTQAVTAIETTAPSGIVVTTEYYTVTLPDSWKGKYIYQVKDNSLTFYHTTSKENGSGGHLFTISLYASNEDYTVLPNYKHLCRISAVDGNIAELMDVVLIEPTDVQFDPENADGYPELSADISTIADSIKLTDKATYAE